MKITVSINVNKPVTDVWKLWSDPIHIVNWNFAHESWCCPVAENDLSVGGKFNYRMEACDKSFGFDFCGSYEVVDINARIVYILGDHLGDHRSVETIFIQQTDSSTQITTTFDMESTNSEELQRNGWQSILNNFKLYAESQS